MGVTSPFPYDSPYAPEVVDPDSGRKTRSPYLAQALVDWLLEQQARVNDSPEQVVTVLLQAQQASIASTPVLPSLASGFYRVSFYARITRAGSISSSLTLIAGWTDSGVSCAKSSAAQTGNTTASTIPDFVVVVRSDQATALTYSTTYLDGGGGTPMQYSLSVTVEAL